MPFADLGKVKVNAKDVKSYLELVSPYIFSKEYIELPKRELEESLNVLKLIYGVATNKEIRKKAGVNKNKRLDDIRVLNNFKKELSEEISTITAKIKQEREDIASILKDVRSLLSEKENSDVGRYIVYLSSAYLKIEALSQSLSGDNLGKAIKDVEELSDALSLYNPVDYIALKTCIEKFVDKIAPAYEAALVFGDNGVFDYLAATDLIPNIQKFWSRIKQVVRTSDYTDLSSHPVRFRLESIQQKRVKTEMTLLWKRAHEALNNFTFLMGLSLIGDHPQHFQMGYPPQNIFGDGKMIDKLTVDDLKTHEKRIEVRRTHDQSTTPGRNRRNRFTQNIKGLKARQKGIDTFARKIVTEEFSMFFWDEQKKVRTGLVGIGDLLGLTVIAESQSKKPEEAIKKDQEVVQDVFSFFQHTQMLNHNDVEKIPFKNLGNGRVNYIEPIQATEKNYYPRDGAPSIKEDLHFTKIIVLWAGWAIEVKVHSPQMEKLSEDPNHKLGHDNYDKKRTELFTRKALEYPQIGFAYFISKNALVGEEAYSIYEDPLLKDFFTKYDVNIRTNKKGTEYELVCRE